MAAPDANVAQLTFESANLEPETFQVVRFEGEEQLSQPFRFVIELLSEDPAVALSDVVNQPAALTVHGVAVHGIVEDIQQRGHTAEYYGYQVVLVPHFALLGLSYQSRIFQEMTVEDIVGEVLDELSGLKYRFELDGSYLTRRYTVQYQETDLNFVSRLLEHEGIWYYFEHTDGDDVLVMTDSPTGGPPIEGDSTLPYNVGAALVAEEEVEAVREFVCHQRVVTGKVVLKDYNYETPDTELVSESQINAEMPGVRYEYGPNYPDQGEGDRLARIRNEEIECRRLVMRGDSDSPRFHAGFKFTLDKHFRDDLNTDFLFTHVRHVGDQGAALPWLSPGEDAPGYRNEFTCIPTEVPFRPPRVTPIPRLHGILTAKVETAGGDYAYIDDMGRYRVKMPFDLSDAGDGTASLPIRMAQPNSGPGYGMHIPNHAGTEMVWACINGDPDRPLALSTVPNPSQASPSTGSNNSQSVFRSWGQNELMFDDAIGSENIFLHATKDRNTVVANDHTESVGNDQTMSVGNDRVRDVGNDETISIGNNQTISVGTNRDKSVGVDQSESIGSNKTIDVGSNHTETIGADKTLSVGSNHTESIGSNMTVTVGSNRDKTVGADQSESVGSNKTISVGSNHTETIGADSSETVGDNKSVDVGADASLNAGSNISHSAGDDVSVQAGKKMALTSGDDFSISGGKKGTITIADELTIKCGSASISMKKNGDITIKGKKISIDGSGDVVIKGKKILQN